MALDLQEQLPTTVFVQEVRRPANPPIHKHAKPTSAVIKSKKKPALAKKHLQEPAETA